MEGGRKGENWKEGGMEGREGRRGGREGANLGYLCL